MTKPTQTETGELRQDPLTEKWVVIAKKRGKRPTDFVEEETHITSNERYKENCPFCNLNKYPQEPDVLRLPNDPETWQVHIFANKYPAFTPKNEFKIWNKGPYKVIESVGYHEVMATRYHDQFDGLLDRNILTLEIEALVMRYRELHHKPSVNYIQIIKNHGPEAGASLEHPHHQIFTVPILPSDISDLLHGAERYGKKNNQKAFSIILEFEREEKTRIVFENEYFTCFCPFASRMPFETWIMPRESNPYFETIGPDEQQALAESLQQILGRIYTGLNNPSYNYYIHSAPCDSEGFVCDKSAFPRFRWHIQILPRLSKFGGFELGTGLEINTMPPEKAAEFLREQSLPTPVA